MNKANKKSVNKNELTQYINSISQYELLDKEQEIELNKRIKNGDKEAREIMINSNLRLVINYALEFASYNVPLMDLIQAGNMGLVTAVDRYDYKFECRFSTYATNWIKEKITNLVYNSNSQIKIPNDTRLLLSHIYKAKQEIIQNTGRVPSDKEIAEYLNDNFNSNVDEIKVRNIQKTSLITLSLDKEINDKNSDFDNLIADNSSKSPSQYADEELKNEFVEEMISSLSERDQIIMCLRYGLRNNKEHTLEEIGNILGYSKERIRQFIKIINFKLMSKYGKEIKELRM